MKRIMCAVLAYTLATSYALAQIITGSVPNTFVNGTIIDATQMNADFSYIVSQVNTNGAKNGANSDITSLAALSTPIPFAAGASSNFVASTVGGTANAVTIASTIPNIAAFTLTSGYQVTFIAGATNTSATTLTVGATTTKNIYKQAPGGLAALTGGEIVAGEYVTVIYDGTQFQLTSDQTVGFGFGYRTSIAGGATVDLSTVPSRNALVTGTTFTVTSLGSPPAALQNIYYMVTWNNSGAVTITSGASITLLEGAYSRTVVNGDKQLWIWNGTSWIEVAFFQANRQFAPASASQLTVTNNAGTPNTQIDVAATEAVLGNTSGGNLYIQNYGTCTINLSTTGAGALDTGSIAANTWYYLYIISTGSTNSCLASTSSSAPTMPTNYSFKVRVGAMKTDGSSNLYRTLQYGNRAQYVTPQSIFDGSNAGVCTAYAVQNATIPNTARVVSVIHAGTSGFYVAGAANATQCAATTADTISNSTAANVTNNNQHDVILESANYYVQSGCATPCGAWAHGWIDRVNAN